MAVSHGIADPETIDRKLMQKIIALSLTLCAKYDPFNSKGSEHSSPY
jgi:hypothetical protein